MKYHVLFTKEIKIKITRIKSNCAVKIKSMNEIQCIKIFRNYVVFLYIFKLVSGQLFLWLVLRIIGLLLRAWTLGSTYTSRQGVET